MTVLLADLLEHLPVPGRRVEVHVDADGAVPCVDLTPFPNGDRRGGPHLQDPICTVHLVLPDPEELADFTEHDAAVRDRYLDARTWIRTSSARLKVAFCPGGEARKTLNAVMLDYDPAVGVVTGSDTCVLGVNDGFAGRGTGRVFTIALPQTLAVRDQWLVPVAVGAAVRHAEMARYEHAGFFAGQHALPEPPPVIELRIGGQVHRVEVLAVAPGYWPMRALQAPDERCARFERAWAEAFPGLGCPIGWLQLEMRRRDPDPRRVPDEPFRMSSEQRATFVRLWRSTWPIPEALATFADRPGWQQALELAEALTVATAGEWSREVELLPHAVRDRWCQNIETLIPVTAAAIYSAAREAGAEIERVPVCAAGRLLAGDRYRDLPDGLPLDSRLVLAWRGYAAGPRDLHVVLLRAQRVLSCPHPGSTPDGGRCLNVRERIEAGGSESAWVHATARQIMCALDDGERPATCEECGTAGPWLITRPAHTGWWTWALCRCGGALQVAHRQDPRNDGPAWSLVSFDELERHAHEHGFGMLVSWRDPEPPVTRDLASEIGRTLPSMAAGGDARWREALRAAAQELAAYSDHPAVPRSSDRALFTWDLYPALTLAALALYVLSEQSGVPPRQLDVQTLLAAGPEELHAHLAAALHNEIDRAQRDAAPEWPSRVEQWPGTTWAEAAYHQIDPVPVAWAALTVPDAATSRDWLSARRFRTGYRVLAALLIPAG